jgi:hypothetical protein
LLTVGQGRRYVSRGELVETINARFAPNSRVPLVPSAADTLAR